MWLREVVFQGVFGLERPARVRVDPGFCNLALPEGASPEDFRTIILSLLYPQEVGSEAITPLINYIGANVRLGLVVAPTLESERTYKLYRRLEDDSIALQSIKAGTRGKEIARGSAEVTEALQQRLGLPSFERFNLVNCWDQSLLKEVAQAAEPAPSPYKANDQPPEVQRLIELLPIARKLEAVDLEIDSLRSDLGEFERKKRQLDKILKREDKRLGRIENIEAALSLSQKERDLIVNFKERQEEFSKRHENYNTEIATTRDNQTDVRPGPLVRDAPFVGCAAGTLILFVVSDLVGIRPLALLNVILLGVVTWALLRRYNQFEQASVFNIRVEQIYRHIENLQQERTDHEREYKRLLVRVNLKDSSEFEDLESELEDLKERITGVDEETREKSAKVNEKVLDFQSQIEALEAKKEGIGECHTPVYEIESMLATYNINHYSIDTGPAVPSVTDERMRVFSVLKDIAVEHELFRDGRLRTRARAAWVKMLTHVLGDDWAEATLDELGNLVYDPSDPTATDRWLDDNPKLVGVVSGLLGAALLASLPDESNSTRFLCLASPYKGLNEKERRRLNKIFNFLAKTSHVLVLE